MHDFEMHSTQFFVFTGLRIQFCFLQTYTGMIIRECHRQINDAHDNDYENTGMEHQMQEHRRTQQDLNHLTQRHIGLIGTLVYHLFFCLIAACHPVFCQNSRLICVPKCTKLILSIFFRAEGPGTPLQAAERTEFMEQKDSRFAVLIDADNVSPKYIKYILDEVSDQGVATYKRIYGDWTDISKKSWKEQLLRYSINPIQQYSNTNGKNSTDSAMIIDAMDILYSGNVEGFCLVSSDSDFTKLAQRLRESGMFVLGMGEQKTPSSFRVACDAFKILEVISQNEDDISPAITAVSESSARYGVSQDEAPSITSKAEIERTVSRVLTENNDHGKNTTLSEIGSILQKKFSEFDVRNYGYSKLSTFLESMNDIEVLKTGHNYLVKERQNTVSRQQIEKCITDLICSNGGHIDNLSIIHDALRSRFPGFDVKQYGYSRISSFINSFKKFKITNNTVQMK